MIYTEIQIKSIVSVLDLTYFFFFVISTGALYIL